MSKSASRSIVLSLFCLVLFAMATTAQPTPRVPPDNDSYLTPKLVKVNGSATAYGVEDATLQGPSIEGSTCDPGGTSTKSVWFTFTLPALANISLDTRGTLYARPTFTTVVALISVYADNGGVLQEQACDSGAFAKIDNLGLTAGTYLVRIADQVDLPPLSPSQARVSIRSMNLTQLLAEENFPNPLDGAWKAKNDTTPAKIVHGCAIVCYVEFQGVAGGKLQQKVALPTDTVKFKANDLLQVSAYMTATPLGGSDVEIALKIAYTDGTPKTKVSVVRSFEETDPNILEYIGEFYANIESVNIKNVKLSFVSPTVDDTFRITSAYLRMYAGGDIRESKGPLPVPGAGGW